MAASIEDSIVAALDHLNVSREKQKIILKKKQETAVKERFVVERTVRINTVIRIYDQYLSGLLSGLFTTNFLHSTLQRSVEREV